ncbi:MAG TPA: DUF1289 domain-containing protein [Pseudomonadales bacterium]
MFRRTPCVGICSTTFGDLVCRGCKRFAHEIVQWNAYDADQRRAVWQRLLTLRAGAVAALLRIRDEALLREQAERAGLRPDDSLAAENVLYELLQRVRWREPAVTLEALGVELAPGARLHLEALPETVLAAIDQEFYVRSLAHYERNYRIPAS